MRRVLLPGATQGEARVEGPRFHHLAVVQRVREGDALEVFDGVSRCFDATVLRLEDSALVLALGAPRPQPPPTPVTVLQGLPKGEKLEWVLQKGTELGASAFAPFEAERSVVRLAKEKAPARAERWRRVVEEAARQCGRADVPVVHPATPLGDALRALAPGTRVLVLDEEERALRLSEAVADAAGAPLALVVGPEGGLSRAEVDALVARGAVPVTLGRRVLRTETAALAALAIVRHLEGELG